MSPADACRACAIITAHPMSETTSRQASWPGAIFALGRVAVVIALVAAAFVWTVGGRHRAAPAAPSGYLQVDLETSPIALDPRFATDAISSRTGELVFDALVRVDAHGQFFGDLAESFERPSPTTLVFHLRRGLRFSDGRPLTARDVKYTYDSILDPASVSPKRIGLRQLAAIAAPDDATVVMTTSGPYAPALEMATMGVVPAGTPLPGKGARAMAGRQRRFRDCELRARRGAGARAQSGPHARAGRHPRNRFQGGARSDGPRAGAGRGHLRSGREQYSTRPARLSRDAARPR